MPGGLQIRLDPNNPGAMPVFSESSGIPVEVNPLNPGAVPVRLSGISGSVPVRVMSGSLDVLFRYSPGDAVSGSFTRASSAGFRNSSGVLSSVSAEVVRDSHYTRDESSAVFVRTLLIEGSTTNQHLNSSDFSNYNPTAGTVTKTANFGVAPDGTTTTTRIQVDGSDRVLRWNSVDTGLDAASTQYCVSIFVKSATANPITGISGRLSSANSQAYLPFGQTSTGWTRFYSEFSNGSFGLPIMDITVVANSDFEIWGIMTEKLKTIPSSYVPSTASAGTRSSDSLTPAGTWTSQTTTLYQRYYDLNSQVESESVSTFDSSGPLALATDRQYLNVVYALGNRSIAYFRSLLGLDNPNTSAADGLKMFKRQGNMLRTVCFVGDSTTSNAATLFAQIGIEQRRGGLLEGTTVLNYGENGASAEAFLGNVVTHGITNTISAASSLYVICYGINDVRTGSCDQSTLTTRIGSIITQIRAALPGSDIILREPNSFTTDDPGSTGFVTSTGIFTGLTLAQASQAATDIMRNTYRSFINQYPNVYVWKTQELIFGEVCTTLASNGKMTDIIHPNATGQAALAAGFLSITT